VQGVLEGELGPRRDIVVLNAAAGLMAARVAASIEEGIEAAAESLDSGAAGRSLDALISASSRSA
jgi:anthranilate phosphoribosyltransferase